MTKNEFYKKWLSSFADGIPKKDIEKYVMSTGNLLLHVFSWELLDENLFFDGEEAKIAYDKEDKQEALYIEWFDGEVKEITKELNTASALDEMTEVYVVAQDFSWTYIKTHESTCGPYFMKL